MTRKNFFLASLVAALCAPALRAFGRVFPASGSAPTEAKGIAAFEIQGIALKYSHSTRQSRVVGRWYGALDTHVRVWKGNEPIALAYGLVESGVRLHKDGAMEYSYWHLPQERHSRAVLLSFEHKDINPYEGLYALEQATPLPGNLDLAAGEARVIGCS